jgi:hypothetical protein
MKWLQSVLRWMCACCNGAEFPHLISIQAIEPKLLSKQTHTTSFACCNLVAHPVGNIAKFDLTYALIPAQYAVTVPEIGATKTAATLESALMIITYDIVKHLTARSLMLVFVDPQVVRDGGYFHTQVDPHTDLEQQAIVEATQLGIAQQMKRKERHLLFALSRPLTRAQASWLDEQTTKLLERHDAKDELERKLDTWLKEALKNRRAAPNE